MRKHYNCFRILLFTIALQVLPNIIYKGPEIFAQSKEYLRTRSSTTATEEAPIFGDKEPLMEYFISVDDELEIFVWQNPDLSKDVIVGPDGYISCPLVGRLKAAGLSLSQLEEELTGRFFQYVKYPKVSVMIKKFAGYQIIILGEVNSPGIYTYKGTINAIEAVALAGDFTDKAHMDSVIVVRGLGEKPHATRINMVKAITKGIVEKEITLKPNDILFVPKTFVANLNKFIGDLGPILGTVDTVLGREKRRW